MRREYFPDDYIAPGEFRFCAGGRHLNVIAESCVLCSSGAVWAGGDNALARAFRREKLIREVRDLLAQTRKDAGVTPLFWIPFVRTPTYQPL